MSNEKTIKPSVDALNEQNEWLRYLKSGKKKKPAIGINQKRPTHGVFLSGKQKRAFRSGEKDPVFIGALNSKQRKALLNGE